MPQLHAHRPPIEFKAPSLQTRLNAFLGSPLGRAMTTLLAAAIVAMGAVLHGCATRQRFVFCPGALQVLDTVTGSTRSVFDSGSGAD